MSCPSTCSLARWKAPCQYVISTGLLFAFLSALSGHFGVACAGDQLIYEVTLTDLRSEGAVVEAKAFLEGELLADAEMNFQLAQAGLQACNQAWSSGTGVVDKQRGENWAHGCNDMSLFTTIVAMAVVTTMSSASTEMSCGAMPSSAQARASSLARSGTYPWVVPYCRAACALAGCASS